MLEEMMHDPSLRWTQPDHDNRFADSVVALRDADRDAAQDDDWLEECESLATTFARNATLALRGNGVYLLLASLEEQENDVAC